MLHNYCIYFLIVTKTAKTWIVRKYYPRFLCKKIKGNIKKKLITKTQLQYVHHHPDTSLKMQICSVLPIPMLYHQSIGIIHIHSPTYRDRWSHGDTHTHTQRHTHTHIQKKDTTTGIHNHIDTQIYCDIRCSEDVIATEFPSNNDLSNAYGLSLSYNAYGLSRHHL